MAFHNGLLAHADIDEQPRILRATAPWREWCGRRPAKARRSASTIRLQGVACRRSNTRSTAGRRPSMRFGARRVQGHRQNAGMVQAARFRARARPGRSRSLRATAWPGGRRRCAPRYRPCGSARSTGRRSALRPAARTPWSGEATWRTETGSARENAALWTWARLWLMSLAVIAVNSGKGHRTQDVIRRAAPERHHRSEISFRRQSKRSPCSRSKPCSRMARPGSA